MPERQTKPIFAKADGTLVAAALNEPSLTLFESPHVMGFLVAQGCQEDSFTGRLQLEDVVGQMLDVTRREVPVPGLGPRLSETAGPWKKLIQNTVMVAKEDAGWTARSSTGELTVSTGATPFVVLFLDPEDHRQLVDEVRNDLTEVVIAHVARRFSVLPLEVNRLLPLWSDLSRLFVPSMQSELGPSAPAAPAPTFKYASHASPAKETVQIWLPPKATAPVWVPGKPPGWTPKFGIKVLAKPKETVPGEFPKKPEPPISASFIAYLMRFFKSLLQRRPPDSGGATMS